MAVVCGTVQEVQQGSHREEQAGAVQERSPQVYTQDG